jgi:integrase
MRHHYRMAQVVNQLTAAKIQRATAGQMLYDGNGLYLRASGPGAGSWEWRYYRFGREHRMGLKSFRHVSLAQARQEVRTQLQVLLSGKDPIQERRTQRVAAQQAEQTRKTFHENFEEYLAARIKAKEWKHPEKAADVRRVRMTLHVYPKLRSVFVDQIDTNMVVEQVLKPMWSANKFPTSVHVCQNIKASLDYAKVMGYRSGDNPAIMKDHIDKVAPRAPDERHYASLHHRELPAFMVELQKQRRAISARALDLEIIVAGRPIEVAAMEWDEIEPSEKVWRIPKERMKAPRDHLVPLSEPALAILDRMKPWRCDKFVFPGRKGGHLASTAMNKLLDGMGQHGFATPHGFRATFRSWGAGKYDPYLLELCLAHKSEAAEVTGTNPALERAYQRDELVELRRPIMEDWANFVMSLIDNRQVDETTLPIAAD